MSSILSLKQRSVVFFWVIALSFACFPASSFAQPDRPEKLEGVGVAEHRGDQVKINDLSFWNDDGIYGPLSTHFKKDIPVLLAMVYYKCPHLCNYLLNGLMDSLKKVDWTPGKQFQLVAVSINAEETPELAREKKANYLKSYDRPGSENGWHFLTGKEDQIQALAEQIGFKYKYDETEKQYAHTAVLFVLTPDGKISNYLYGITFPTKSLKFSLIEASKGKVGSVMEQVLLFCFHFDPSTNSYTFRMWRVVQVILSLQALALGFLVYRLKRKEKVEVDVY